MLRTPLDRSSGTLSATPSAYDPLVRAVDGPRGSASERLAVYNRQYWFRLFRVMQGCFPLTTRLLGHWTFNGHAGRFLLEHAPHGWDIEQASEGFVTWLATSLKGGLGPPQLASQLHPPPASAGSLRSRKLASQLHPPPASAGSLRSRKLASQLHPPPASAGSLRSRKL